MNAGSGAYDLVFAEDVLWNSSGAYDTAVLLYDPDAAAWQPCTITTQVDDQTIAISPQGGNGGCTQFALIAQPANLTAVDQFALVAPPFTI